MLQPIGPLCRRFADEVSLIRESRDANIVAFRGAWLSQDIIFMVQGGFLSLLGCPPRAQGSDILLPMQQTSRSNHYVLHGQDVDLLQSRFSRIVLVGDTPSST